MFKQQRSHATWVITLLRGGCRALVALGTALSGIVSGAGNPAPLTPAPRPAVSTTATGLLVEWRVPEAQLVARADGSIALQVPGATQSARAGAPVLPFFSVLVAVPPGALPTLHAVLLEETERPLPGPLALAPFPEGVRRDAAGHIVGGEFAPALVGTPASSDVGDPVVLEPVGVVRGVSLARLVFYPARPIGGYPQTRLRVATHVRVTLTFAEQPGDLPAKASPDAASLDAASLDPLLAALSAAVINPTRVQPATAAIQTPPADSASVTQSSDAGASWMIEVSAPGLTALTYAALAESGYPVGTVDPNTLRLMREGQDVAAEWYGNGNASFEPGERLLFYAAPRFSRWTTSDVYLLRHDGVTPGLRMQSQSAAPAGHPLGSTWVEATAEANQLYTADCFCGTLPPGRDGDRWTWDDLKRPGHATDAYTLALSTVDATQPATLTLWLIGYTDLPAITPDHRVAATLNTMFLGTMEWNGRQAITATLPIPPGLLRPTNTLTLTLPGLPGVDIEGTWLDAFAIRYARGNAPMGDTVSFTGQPTPHAYRLTLSATVGLRAYDVTNPDRPLRLTGVLTDGYTASLSDPLVGGSHHYALMTDSGMLFPVTVRPVQTLQTTGGFAGADYVIIAPTDFVPALDDLVALRRAQGLTVAVAAVQAIYDTYGDGRPAPAAIRAYLADAYAAWTPRPTYVLLVGAGSFDPRRYRDTSPPSWVPPYLADVDPWAGETAADNRYVTVDGVDNLPDMLIGRLPVQTLTETQTVVDKIVQYETYPFPGGWNETVTFVADDADEAGDFAAASEVMAATYVTAPFTVQRAYFTPPATTITSTRQAVLNALNAGALIVQYTGHSSWQQWAAERFLHLDDMSALRNDRRWPIVIEMTCFTGAFQRPEPTLDAGLLTLNSGGVVAAWGATGLGVSTGHSSLADGFFRAVFSDTVSTVGQATLAGKLSLVAAGQNYDLLDTFTLLGDPALRPNRTIIPWASRTYLPIVMRKEVH
ncbi:MAG: C25 family cysteine peptidase [Anaerolineae bacterium]|nr:C25 family cysteine peptidase [Anaerolineae bacterium]